MSDPIQEQLITARRNQILDAAAAVFAEKGFHPTTIKDIARRAGIADGTIYNYFTNKPALLLGIFDRMRTASVADLDISQLDLNDMHAVIREFIRQPLIDASADQYELFRIVISEMMVNQELRNLYQKTIMQPTFEMVTPVLQHWMDQGRIRPMPVELLARLLSSTVFGLILAYVGGDELLNAEWDDLPDYMATIILHGIGVDGAV